MGLLGGSKPGTSAAKKRGQGVKRSKQSSMLQYTTTIKSTSTTTSKNTKNNGPNPLGFFSAPDPKVTRENWLWQQALRISTSAVKLGACDASDLEEIEEGLLRKGHFPKLYLELTELYDHIYEAMDYVPSGSKGLDPSVLIIDNRWTVWINIPEVIREQVDKLKATSQYMLPTPLKPVQVQAPARADIRTTGFLPTPEESSEPSHLVMTSENDVSTTIKSQYEDNIDIVEEALPTPTKPRLRKTPARLPRKGIAQKSTKSKVTKLTTKITSKKC